MKFIYISLFQLLVFSASFIYGLSDKLKTSLSDKEVNLVRDLTIGGANSDVIFGNWPLKITVGYQGRVFVADPQSYSIKVFSTEGDFIQDIGQQGRGPKEFGYLRSVDTGSEERLYVLDGNDRISIFDGESLELIDELRVPRIAAGWSPHEMMVVNNGFVIVYNQSFTVGDKPKERTNKLSLIDWQGNFVHEELKNIRSDQLYIMNSGSSLWRTALPFGRKSHLEVGNFDTIFYGWSENLNIVKLDLSGTPKDTVHFSYTPVSVTNKDLEDVLEYPPSTKQGKALRNDAEIPQYFPAYNWFVVDDKNRMWLAVNTEDRENYSLHIIDKDGDLLDKTSLPKTVELQVISDSYAYGVQEADNGVQTVVRYKIHGLD